MSSRTRKPADVRRNELLDAALTVLRSRGVERATVEEFTEAAGVSKGSFYLHFRAKDDFLDALRERMAEVLAAQVAELPRPTRATGWPRYTAALVRRALEAQLAAAELHSLIAGAAHRRHGPADAHGAPADPAARALAEIVQAGVDAGAYRVTDIEATVRLLYALLHAAGDWACADPADLERVVAAATELTRRMLEA